MPLNLVTCLFHKQIKNDIQVNLFSVEGVINRELITRIDNKIGQSDYEIKDYFNEDINEIQSLVYDDEVENHYFLIYSTDILMIKRFYSFLKNKSFEVIVIDKNLSLNFINSEVEMTIYITNKELQLKDDKLNSIPSENIINKEMYEPFINSYSCECGNLKSKLYEHMKCPICNTIVKYNDKYDTSSDLIIKATAILKSLNIKDEYTESKINETIGILVKAVSASVRETKLFKSNIIVKR